MRISTFIEGNENGRFFFIRNVEEESKELTLRIGENLLGQALCFKTVINGGETKMLPIAFRIPGSELTVLYGTSEVLLSKEYDEYTAFVVCGKK